jgi:integrase
MARSQTTITKRTVDALKPGEVLWDDEVRGFGVRCQTKTKTYVLKYRFKGRQRWMTIGRHGSPWTVQTARQEAQRLLGDLHSGIDVASLRDHDRRQPTIEDLCNRFIEDYANQHKKPRSVKSDRSNAQNHVIPLLGHLRVKDVTRADIEAFKLAVTNGKTANLATEQARRYRGGNVVKGGSGAANRCLALLSKMFNMAEAWGLRDENTNPVRLVKKYAENKRQRFLSPPEIQQLLATLKVEEQAGTTNTYAIAAIRLLLFTGARLGEILSLQWQQIHFDHEIAILPDSKTGERVLYLNEPSIALLRKLPRVAGNPYVIIGKHAGKPLNNLRKPWHIIRRKAGLADVRLHDLRHSFASTAAANGASLMMIGKLLGHTQVQTTARYSHLVADPVREVANSVGKAINGDLHRFRT